MNWNTIFLVAAIILFALDGLKVQSDRFNWTPLGFACVVASFVV